MERVRLFGEIALDDPFSGDPRLALLCQLAPRIGARIVERPRVERVGSNRAVDVIVPERDIVPLVGGELFLGDFYR